MGSNGGVHRFIDKRNAVTYTLVASATGDSGDGSGRVFLRTDHNDHLPSPLTDDEQPEVHPADPSSALPPSRRQELRELGLPDDGYDYLQHIKSCSSQPQPGVTQLDSPLPVSASLPPDSKAYDARSALTSAEASALPPQPDSTVASSVRPSSTLIVSASPENEHKLYY
jgi:protein LTV1